MGQKHSKVVEAMDQPIRIGISACLLGQEVRFDGGHKKDGFLVHTLGEYVEWVAVCPEVEIGLGIPRPTLRLERAEGKDGVRMVMPKTGEDYTDRMVRYAEARMRRLEEADLDGYILKKDSPSCGMMRLKVYDVHGVPKKEGVGLYAEVLMRRFPNLPVEEEGRLNDPRLRDNFIERVFAHRRLKEAFRGNWTRGGLVAFHTRHKLTLMAHSEKHYRDLGKRVAGIKQADRTAFRETYEREFMECLKRIATVRRNTNVLMHILGYFKNQLAAADRQELLSVIEDYHRELVPLVVPMTLIRHYVRLLDIAYLRDQTYLAPHPKELMLRNHV